MKEYAVNVPAIEGFEMKYYYSLGRICASPKYFRRIFMMCLRCIFSLREKFLSW